MTRVPVKTTVLAIIWTNVILFAVSLFFSRGIGMTLNPLHALSPSTKALIFLGASGTIPIDTYQEWASLFTANWLHGSLLHILFNMMALRTLAPLVIDEFGTYKMFSIYTLSGVAGFLVSYVGGVSITIGASSGLCGLIGALLYFGKSRGGIWGAQVFHQTKAWIFSLVLIGLIIPNINNWGHGGGFAGGFILAMAFGYDAQRKESTFDRITAIALAVLTVLLLLRSVVQGVALILS